MVKWKSKLWECPNCGLFRDGGQKIVGHIYLKKLYTTIWKLHCSRCGHEYTLEFNGSSLVEFRRKYNLTRSDYSKIMEASLSGWFSQGGIPNSKEEWAKRSPDLRSLIGSNAKVMRVLKKAEVL